MKKFVNDPQQFVPEMLKGIALANPKTLKYIPEYNLIMRTDAPRDDKVSVIQGSGSGHEPAHVMIVAMLRASIEGIKKRGHSDVGDKTLLDALVPVTDTIEQQVTAGADAATTLRATATTARESAEATKSMQAMRGRASYTGERSIGTLDAGAVAIGRASCRERVLRLV